ncbi:MAG: hypothetical protein SAJ37_04190 [Oscillatoria sp. PMC 1068.18]|nr:hypothetical protein [Oscillatoria sp. PMC 1076.18]MEC4987927.1 hypothetical protein [Oscillatoria sp. PMC 1068.18]
MNSQENQNWQQKLQELEKEVNQDYSSPTSYNSEPGKPLQTQSETSADFSDAIAKLQNWFASLPTAGKVAVVAIAAIVGFSLLRTVLQLVASLISLAILGVVLYLLYKFFIAPQSPE